MQRDKEEAVPSALALIYEAITKDDVDALTELMAFNPEQLNANTVMAGQTWLGYAASAGKIASVQSLISLGADLNIGDDHYGSKPICSACSNGHKEIARFLVKSGSDIDTDKSGRNPLFASIVGRSSDCTAVVLATGIDASIRYNIDTMTDMDAMAFALMRGERECAEIIARWISSGNEAEAASMLNHADYVAERNAYAKYL